MIRDESGVLCWVVCAVTYYLQQGGEVGHTGFPDIGLQGFAPKLAKGEIASLSGAADDPRYFQISVPVQPGNSGGALVDERGPAVRDELRSQEQFSVELPRIRTGGFGQTQIAGYG